jgi:hypothetical protein
MPATDPAALLTYAINPSQLFVGTTNALTLEVRNDTTAAIAFRPATDRVVVTFPAGAGADALSTVVDYTPTPLTDGFTAVRVEGTNGYSVRASGFVARSLAPGQSIRVRFDGVKVNGVPSDDVRVGVEERVKDQVAPASVKLAKLPQKLKVVAWLEQPVVGLGGRTRLNWLSFGGTRVVVFPFVDGRVDPGCPAGDRKPGYRCFPVTGEPPSPGSVEVVPGDPARAQWRYTVRLLTGTGEQDEVEVTLTQHAPAITGFGRAPGMDPPTDPIGAMDEVPLQWTTFYGQRAWLQTPTESAGQQVHLNPAAPRPVKPGFEAYRAAADVRQIPASADYVLRVSGFAQPAESRLTFRLNPVRALYYRFAKLEGTTLSDPVWQVDPRGWPAVEEVRSTPPYTLTVYGPGGTKQVLYLGPGDTVHPQVQYFAATAAPAKKTLRWVTANLTALRLDPGAYVVPAADVAAGTYEVTPTQTTDYVLTATAANGETVTSTLRVVP